MAKKSQIAKANKKPKFKTRNISRCLGAEEERGF